MAACYSTSAVAWLNQDALTAKDARAYLEQLKKPGFDFLYILKSEGWWRPAGVTLAMPVAVEIARGFRNQMNFMSSRWYVETQRLYVAVQRKLAAALGITVTEVAAQLQDEAVLPRSPRAPRRLDGHRYLGAFDVHGSLLLADPCYSGSSDPDLVCTTRALSGRWHAYVRCEVGQHWAAALLVVHAENFATATELGRSFGVIAVDSGRIAVLDRNPTEGLDDEWGEGGLDDGMLDNNGCVVATAYGDGGHGARRHCIDRQAVMVRVNLTGKRIHDRFGA